MVETLIFSLVIIAAGMLLLLVKVLSRKNGTFSSQHIHDSEAMKERGIHCVMDQDREMRRKSRFAVSERTKWRSLEATKERKNERNNN